MNASTDGGLPFLRRHCVHYRSPKIVSLNISVHSNGLGKHFWVSKQACLRFGVSGLCSADQLWKVISDALVKMPHRLIELGTWWIPYLSSSVRSLFIRVRSLIVRVVRVLFLKCLLCVCFFHQLCIACSQFGHCLFIMFIVCSLSDHSLFFFCSLCSLCACYLIIVCVVSVHCLFAVCALADHSLFIIRSLRAVSIRSLLVSYVTSIASMWGSIIVYLKGQGRSQLAQQNPHLLVGLSFKEYPPSLKSREYFSRRSVRKLSWLHKVV